LDDGRVAAVNPVVPGVDVTNRGGGSSSSGDDRASTLDVVNQDVRALSQATLVQNTLDGNPVKVLGTNRNTDDEIGEGSAILLDGVPESVQLVLEHIAACRRPQTQQEAGLGIDGGLDGRDGCVGSSSLDHRVESR
jgi:hypothetical protein